MLNNHQLAKVKRIRAHMIVRAVCNESLAAIQHVDNNSMTVSELTTEIINDIKKIDDLLIVNESSIHTILCDAQNNKFNVLQYRIKLDDNQEFTARQVLAVIKR